MSEQSAAASVPALAAVPATVAELLARAANHGLALTARSPDLDNTGLDFVVAHAEDAAGQPWIVRCPRRPAVVAGAAIEARVLAVVRRHLAVPVPDWQIHAPDVIAYPRIAGTPAVTTGADGIQWNVIDPAAPSPVFLDSYARVLAALQAIPAAELRAGGVPERDIAANIAQIREAAAQTRNLLEVPDATWDRWHAWLDDPARWPPHLAMVHGDLHPGHLLLADDGALCGVLDWTEGQLSDPVIDFAMFLGGFGRAATAALVERFVAHGGVAWPGLLDHAAMRWSMFAALGAAWALKANIPGFVDQVVAHFKAQLAVDPLA